ncbi:MAG: hypothetical protein ACK5QT_05240 [Oligoflexia bacterium]|jgi:hypothetical protein
MTPAELELRAELDLLKIEVESLRRTLSGLVEHFDDRLHREHLRVVQEFNPEREQIGGATRAA